jgi:membrane protein DedA with SNARE-associated domain
MSLSPDFCVRQSETVFAKVGPWSLLFAKFFPGLSIISVAMAGVTKMSLPVFLSLNGIGALLSVSVPVVLGWIFKNAITDILFTLADIGKLGVVAVFAALLWQLPRQSEGSLKTDSGTTREPRGPIPIDWVQGVACLHPDRPPNDGRAAHSAQMLV